MTLEEMKHQQETATNAQIGALVMERHGLRRQKYLFEAQIDESARLFGRIANLLLSRNEAGKNYLKSSNAERERVAHHNQIREFLENAHAGGGFEKVINLHVQVGVIDSRLKYVDAQLRALGLSEDPAQRAPDFEIVDSPRPE